jgi:hypothetical protein
MDLVGEFRMKENQDRVRIREGVPSKKEGTLNSTMPSDDNSGFGTAIGTLNIPGIGLILTDTTKPVSIGRRISPLKTFAGIDSTCVSVLSGTIRPIDPAS